MGKKWRLKAKETSTCSRDQCSCMHFIACKVGLTGINKRKLKILTINIPSTNYLEEKETQKQYFL